MDDVRAPDVLRHLGKSASEIEHSLNEFSRSAECFSSHKPRMIDCYENKWVAVYKGNIEAVADSLDELTREVEKKNIPTEETLIRFVDREEKTLIL